MALPPSHFGGPGENVSGGIGPSSLPVLVPFRAIIAISPLFAQKNSFRKEFPEV